MTKPLILVSGATGKTGTSVVEQLLERGFSVRALAHRADARSERIADLGAEVVFGDFLDIHSIRAALQGVRRAYFCYPPHLAELVEATTIFAIAARGAGVQTVVNMSQVTARETATSPLSRHHWVSEQILDWADLGAVHVRPTFFAENLIIFGSATIGSEGKLYLPYGDEQHAPVAAEDIARVVTAILAEPQPHLGQRYVLTGPTEMSLVEIAAVLSAELGRTVEYVDLPIAAWGQVLREQLGLPKFLATHLESVAQDHQDGVFHVQTDVVERIGGHRPMTLNAFVRANAETFLTPGALLNV